MNALFIPLRSEEPAVEEPAAFEKNDEVINDDVGRLVRSGLCNDDDDDEESGGGIFINVVEDVKLEVILAEDDDEEALKGVRFFLAALPLIG